MALGIQATATVALRFTAKASEGEQTRCTRLTATFQVHAADASLIFVHAGEKDERFSYQEIADRSSSKSIVRLTFPEQPRAPHEG
jgi:hypothetical protein